MDLLLGQAGSAVTNLDTQELPAAALGGHAEFAFHPGVETDYPLTADRLGGIFDQVEERSLQRGGIAYDRWQAGVEVLNDANGVGSARIQPGHPERLVQHLMDIDGISRETLRGTDGENLFHEPGDP